MKKNILTKTIFATFLLFFFSFGFTFAEDVAVLLNKDGQPVSKLNYSNSFFSKIKLNIKKFQFQQYITIRIMVLI